MSLLADLQLTHERTIRTDLTCNCLLPGHRGDALTSPSTAWGDESNDHFYAAFYQLHASSPTESTNDAPQHTGDLVKLARTRKCAAGSAPSSPENDDVSVAARTSSSPAHAARTEAFPGVFDVTRLPDDTRLPTRGSPLSEASLLLAACTDGSARLLDAASLDVRQVFASIHAEMLTSASPLLTYGDGGPVLTQLLCTAHTGAVVLYDLAEAQVTQTLEGHEFDAWCGAVRLEAEGDLGSGARLLLSGGDDGLVKFYDSRAGHAATGRMRFDAGVVSVSPVVHTPYLLVGSYAETLSLVDERFRKRPVAERAGLGGGVWRTNRLLPPWLTSAREGGPASTSSPSPLPPGCVPPAGALVLPLMQRGAAIVAYDTTLPAESVFSSPLYLHRAADEPDSGETHPSWLPGSVCGTVTDDLLVYDTAVLGTASETESVDVATCSFYEKRIDLWRVTRA